MAIEIEILQGDCLDVLSRQKADSIDLIITSPLTLIAAEEPMAELIPINMSIGF